MNWKIFFRSTEFAVLKIRIRDWGIVISKTFYSPSRDILCILRFHEIFVENFENWQFIDASNITHQNSPLQYDNWEAFFSCLSYSLLEMHACWVQSFKRDLQVSRIILCWIGLADVVWPFALEVGHEILEGKKVP